MHFIYKFYTPPHTSFLHSTHQKPHIIDALHTHIIFKLRKSFLHPPHSISQSSVIIYTLHTHQFYNPPITLPTKWENSEEENLSGASFFIINDDGSIIMKISPSLSTNQRERERALFFPSTFEWKNFPLPFVLTRLKCRKLAKLGQRLFVKENV